MTQDASITLLTADLSRHDALLKAAEPLHRQLRPAIPEPYVQSMHRVFADGAEMAVLIEDTQVRALAVFRSYVNTWQGHRLYVDDLVTDETMRSRGYGGRMLGWCEAEARNRGCAVLALDSGTQRTAAHRFYFRQGMTINAFNFVKAL